MNKIYIGLACLLVVSCAKHPSQDIVSPDKHLHVHLSNDDSGLHYSISREDKTILKNSVLGLELTDADFTKNLSIKNTSAIKTISDNYEMMVGKKHKIHYEANEKTYTVKNAAGQELDIIFRVSNDGVAFRYRVANPSKNLLQFKNETTSFAFADTTKAWMQPMSVAKTGWSRVNPAYEEHYVIDVPVGTVSPSSAGWVFPALFKVDNTWVALSESNMDGSFHASRLQPNSAQGEYKIGLPSDVEIFPNGKLLAETAADMITPWRVLAVGDLATVMQSTLVTDVADPAIPFDKKLVQPGQASWSWPLMGDNQTVYDVQKKFIDYAAEMHWDYTLIDSMWDSQIGYEKIKELIDYAATKNVGILLWYNSNGDWNDAPQTPRHLMLTHESRVKEFARLREMGVKGLKIDFFGGDGKSMIAYYVDILKDAADYGLLINFHGATLPRGWQRTYPNLMTAEAIKGFEFTTFSQVDEDAAPAHIATALFARNLFDPMDYTPMVFGDIPKIKRSTRNGFEIAESILFISGIQHFVEIPEGMATAPDYVKTFLQDIPRNWDDVKFIDGVPGKYVVIARKSGDSWYVAGLNAEATDINLSLDLSFIGNKKASLITDGATEREFTQTEIASDKATPVTIKSHGGFVAVFK